MRKLLHILMNRCILVEVRIQYVPYYLSGTCTVPLLAYHPRLPNLCSQRPDDTPALHFFDSVLAQSSLFLYFFRSVPLITGLPPVGGFLLNLEHLNVRPFIVSWGLRGIYSQLVSSNYYGFGWLLTIASSWTVRAVACLLARVTMPHIPFLFVSSDFCRLAYFSA